MCAQKEKSWSAPIRHRYMASLSKIPQISENSNIWRPDICALWVSSHIKKFRWDNRNQYRLIIYKNENFMIECQIILVVKNFEKKSQNMLKYGLFFGPSWEMRAQPAVDRAPWNHIAWRHPASDQPLPKKIICRSIGIYMCSASNFIKNDPPKYDPYLGGVKNVEEFKMFKTDLGRFPKIS